MSDMSILKSGVKVLRNASDFGIKNNKIAETISGNSGVLKKCQPQSADQFMLSKVMDTAFEQTNNKKIGFLKSMIDSIVENAKKY